MEAPLHLPKLKIREVKDDSMIFEVENTAPYFVNAIRRILLAEIPKFGVSRVRVFSNDTPLFDEYIIHRIAMIPFKTPIEMFFDEKGNFNPPPENSEEFELPFSLQVTNNEKEVLLVTSKDIQPAHKFKEIKPVYENIPIAELLPGQELQLEIIVAVGFGKQHAKWEVAVAPGFKPYPQIAIEGCKYPKGCPDAPCVEICPQEIFKKKKDKIEIQNIEKCRMCRDCVEVCPHEAIKVEGDESHYLFHFETDLSMKAIEALWAAANIWKWKLEQFKEKFEKFCEELKGSRGKPF